MQIPDWIVVGNGLTGAALSYELARHGCMVLLLEQSATPASATRYSYGSIAHWSGTTPLSRRLCHESMARHRALASETGVDTELRDLDLVMVVDRGADPAALDARYATAETQPVRISTAEAVERAPLLDPEAIAGALLVRHRHVNPMALVRAYNRGLEKFGGRIEIATVTGFQRTGDRLTGVVTSDKTYAAGNVAVAAGGFTRELLKSAGVRVPVYFTHAELIETPPLDLQLHAQIMPADLSRTGLESGASDIEVDARWDVAGEELVPPIFDIGCIQFQDKSVRIGQISRINTALRPKIDANASERQLRQGITRWVPALAAVPGQWRSCPVAFSCDGLPLVGPVPGLAGVAVFSGFSSPFALAPAAAVWFARWATGEGVSELEAIAPGRFAIAQTL